MQRASALKSRLALGQARLRRGGDRLEHAGHRLGDVEQAGVAGTDVALGDLVGDQVEDVQRQAIVEALEKTRYNKTAAAKLLGLSFRQLRYRIKKLGIE